MRFGEFLKGKLSGLELHGGSQPLNHMNGNKTGQVIPFYKARIDKYETEFLACIFFADKGLFGLSFFNDIVFYQECCEFSPFRSC